MAHFAATLSMLLLLACLLQHAYAAEQATTILPIVSTTILPVVSTTIIPVVSTTIIPVVSTTILPIVSTTIESTTIESTTISPIESTIIVPEVLATTASPVNEVVSTVTSVTPTIADAVTTTLKPNLAACSGTTLLFSNLIQTVQTHRSLNRFHADLDKLDGHLEQKAAEFAKDHKYRNLVVMMRKLLDVLNSTVTSSNYTVNTTAENVVNTTEAAVSATRRPISRPIASLTIIRRPSYAVGTDAALYRDKLMNLWQYAYYRPWFVKANSQYKDNDKDDKDDDEDDDEDDYSYRNRYFNSNIYYKRRQ